MLWHDWPRCRIRRNWLKVIRSETVEISMGASPESADSGRKYVITRAERAHWRLTWHQRLARNVRPSTAQPLTLILHGLPATFAHSYGFPLLDVV